MRKKRASGNVPAATTNPPTVRLPGRWQRIAVSVFLLFHLMAIVSWSLPLNSLVVERWKQAIHPYMLWSGLFQAWDMFAPEPMKLNSYVEAQITFRDGSTRTWAAPRMHELGLADRYFKERYRKFSTEYLRADNYAGLWPDAARYIARLNRGDAANPPVSVSLTRSWSEINPPGPAGLYQPGPWLHYTYFIYAVTPGDLQ